MNEILDLTAFKKAISTLSEALNEYEKDKTNTFVRDSCIQRFEYCFYMSKKMLIRYLKSISDDFLLNKGKNTEKFNGLLGASRGGDLIGLPKFVRKNDLSKFSNPNYSELSPNIGLLTSSSVGDSQHLESPIALVDKKEKSITFIAKNRTNNSSNKALEIQTIGKYLLIADEYSFDNFVIYNIKTKKIILKANSSFKAQWL